MFEHFEYVTLTQLSQIFGVNLKEIDKGLVECGLRKNHKPTEKAKAGGFVKTVEMPGGEKFYTWHREMTVAELSSLSSRPFGEEQIDQIVNSTNLKLITQQPPAQGPFVLRKTEGIGLQFFDANGIDRLQSTDEPFANQILQLITQAHEKLGWWS